MRKTKPQTLPEKQEYGETSDPQKEETARKPYQEQSRKRRHSKISTLPAEERIKKAEKAIEGLKRHTDKGTCPVSFRYKARANVKADEQFKSDVKRIRKAGFCACSYSFSPKTNQ